MPDALGAGGKTSSPQHFATTYIPHPPKLPVFSGDESDTSFDLWQYELHCSTKVTSLLVNALLSHYRYYSLNC
jgi:hypothetical protein